MVWLAGEIDLDQVDRRLMQRIELGGMEQPAIRGSMAVVCGTRAFPDAARSGAPVGSAESHARPALGPASGHVRFCELMIRITQSERWVAGDPPDLLV